MRLLDATASNISSPLDDVVAAASAPTPAASVQTEPTARPHGVALAGVALGLSLHTDEPDSGVQGRQDSDLKGT